MILKCFTQKLLVKMLVNSFEFTDNHNSLDKEIGAEQFQISNILVIDFGPIQIGGIENRHGIFFDEGN